MKKTGRIATTEKVKHFADWQQNWGALIEPLRRAKYLIESTEKLSIHGDAPKGFVRVKEHARGRRCPRPGKWPAFIAKVGSKWYPVESITEHFLTRCGQAFGVRIAESQLRLVGGQVRFLSRYFLASNESLVHGIEVFKRYLDDEMVEAIAASRREQEFYTFQTVCAAICHAFPEHHENLVADLVEMLAFDALVGHNDRHPANWGIIVPLAKHLSPRFSPVFDTARALFWNMSEKLIKETLSCDKRFGAYLNGTRPQIGWDECPKIGHFDLVRKIATEFPAFRPRLDKFNRVSSPEACVQILDEEFAQLFSERRRLIIRKCLECRFAQYRGALA